MSVIILLLLILSILCLVIHSILTLWLCITIIKQPNDIPPKIVIIKGYYEREKHCSVRQRNTCNNFQRTSCEACEYFY